METVLEYLKECGVFYLATSEGDQPHVRPFGAVAEFEGKLYISTNNKKNVYQQMLKNEKVEISAMGKDGSWIRLEAISVADDRKDARVKMLEANPSITSMYSADDGIMEVLYLKDATATIYSFTKEPVTVTF